MSVITEPKESNFPTRFDLRSYNPTYFNVVSGSVQCIIRNDPQDGTIFFRSSILILFHNNNKSFSEDHYNGTRKPLQQEKQRQ